MRRVQSKVIILLMVTGVLLLITMTVFSFSTSAKVSRDLSGNPEDMNPPLSGVAYNLGGGGLDVDTACNLNA